MNYSLANIADAAAEPVTVEEALAHLLLKEDDPARSYVEALIPDARDMVEGEIGCPIGEQTFELGLPGFTPAIEFPRPPLRSIISIKYMLADGSIKVLEDSEASPPNFCGLYTLETGSKPGALFLKFDQMWPYEILAYGFPLKIRYKAGYDPVPAGIRRAILLTIGHLFENREASLIGVAGQPAMELPLGARDACAKYKYVEFA